MSLLKFKTIRMFTITPNINHKSGTLFRPKDHDDSHLVIAGGFIHKKLIEVRVYLHMMISCCFNIVPLCHGLHIINCITTFHS